MAEARKRQGDRVRGGRQKEKAAGFEAMLPQVA